MQAARLQTFAGEKFDERQNAVAQLVRVPLVVRNRRPGLPVVDVVQMQQNALGAQVEQEPRMPVQCGLQRILQDATTTAEGTRPSVRNWVDGIVRRGWHEGRQARNVRRL